MSKLTERNQHIEEIIELAQDSGAIGAVAVIGDDNTPSDDLRIVAVPDSDSSAAVAYTRLCYMVSSELEIASSQVVSKDENLRAKKFELSDGVVLTICVTSLANVKTGGWYRLVWDDMNASATLTESVPEDILCDIAPQPAEEPEMVDDFDDIAEEPAVVAAPVVTEAPAEKTPAAESDAEVKDYLEFISRNLKNAQRAIAAGQLIRAGEIVAVLRKMAIELICVRNGIESNYEQSIDFIDCEEKHMLAKTYPRNMDQKSMVTALGTLSELFDRLV